MSLTTRNLMKPVMVLALFFWAHSALYAMDIESINSIGFMINSVKADAISDLTSNQLSEKLLKKAQGLFQQACEYHDKDEFDKARPLFEKIIRKHYDSDLVAEAHLYMGEMTRAKDKQQAYEHYEKILKRNNAHATAGAHVRLGEFHLSGVIVRPNIITALFYFTHAAHQNANLAAQAMAHYYLGMLYFTGNGVRSNLEEAEKYLTKIDNEYLVPEITAEVQTALARIHIRKSQNQANKSPYI